MAKALDIDLIKPELPPTAEPVKRARRTPNAPAGKKLYDHSLTLCMTEARYMRWRMALVKNKRMGQELLTELVDKWMDRMDKKEAKALLGEVLDDTDD